MSSALPTEEDVLAVLVLNSALGQLIMTDFGGVEAEAIRSACREWETAPEYDSALIHAAHERLMAHDRDVVAAIADTERRYEVERAAKMVLRSAYLWAGRGSIWAGHLRDDARAFVEAFDAS